MNLNFALLLIIVIEENIAYLPMFVIQLHTVKI